MRRQDGGGSGRAGELLPLLQPPLRLLGMGTPRALLTVSCGLGDPEEERGASRWAVPRKPEIPRSEGQEAEREKSAGKAQRGQRQLEALRAPAGAWLAAGAGSAVHPRCRAWGTARCPLAPEPGERGLLVLGGLDRGP